MSRKRTKQRVIKRKAAVTRSKKSPVAAKKKMSKKELAAFKTMILKRKEEIIDDIRHISDDTLKKSQKEASGDISGYTYHMADVATDTYDREFSLSLASSDREALYELDDALKKIEDGSFGVCEGCGMPIAKNRLKAVLNARFCLKCQKKKESR